MMVLLAGELADLPVGEAGHQQLRDGRWPEGGVGVALQEAGLGGDDGHEVLVPGRPPALAQEPDEVGGPPGDGGQGLQVQLVAGAEVVLAERGGRAAVHTALAAGGRQVGHQLLQHGNLDNSVTRYFKNICFLHNFF